MLAKKKKSLYIPGVTVLYKLGVKPNHLTVIGLILAVIALFQPLVPALILFATAFVIDVLDGNLARKHNLKTVFGGFLDSVIDKTVEILFIFYIANLYGVQQLGMLAIGLSIMISYVKHRARLELHSFFDRAERLIFLLLFIIFFNNQAVIAFSVYNIFCSLAIIQLIVKVARRL